MNWMHKTVMEMTLIDEIQKTLCILGTLAVIGLIGWAVDLIESNWRRKMNRNRTIKIDFRINGRHDHFIEKRSGKSASKLRTTKKRMKK